MSSEAPTTIQLPEKVRVKLEEKMRDLFTKAVQLVTKTAICKCEKRDNCKVFEMAREMAVIIDEVQELSPVRLQVGSGRRKTRP